MKPKGLSRRNFIKRSSYLGSAAAIQSLGLSGLLAASKSYASNDYKALVFIFLNGGNDAFNMLVPRSGTLRTDYETGRGIVALPTNQLHTLNLSTPAQIYGGGTFSDFGFHPDCSDMADMFNAQEMSVVCNVGNLYEPTTRDQFLAGTTTLPPQLFSHADQQRQFQSEPSLPFQFGWGGKLAELTNSYNSSGNVSPLMSLSGLNPFQVSQDPSLSTYVLGADGLTSLWNYYGTRKTMVEQSMAGIDNSSHLMMQKYRGVFDSAIDAEQVVNGAFT